MILLTWAKRSGKLLCRLFDTHKDIVMTKHQTTYKLRLYPDKEQEAFLNSQLGACRKLWNTLLGFCIDQYKLYEEGLLEEKPKINVKVLRNEYQRLKEGEFSWLDETLVQCHDETINDLVRTYNRFFKKISGYPRFKSKRFGGSFRYPNKLYTKFKDSKLFIYKHKSWIKARGYVLDDSTDISSCRVVRTPTGKWYVCLVSTVDEIEQKKTNRYTSIDMGIKTLMMVSEVDGTRKRSPVFKAVENSKFYLKSQKKLRYLQRQLSRKKKGSKNREKVRIKVARCHEKIANQRKDAYHKVTTEIVNNCDKVFLEDLNISGMIKNRKLSKHIADASWGILKQMFMYKLERRKDKTITFVDRFGPSTQVCSNCGVQSKVKIELNVREWDCSECGAHHDRDENAALNIFLMGVKREEFYQRTAG